MMKFILNESLAMLGIKNVVIGIAKNVDPHAPLPASFLKKQKEMEKWALNCDIDEVSDTPVIQGYKDLLQSIGRSVKKNPPTVLALIRNIRHRGSIPNINSIIDIYNVESLHSLLAIGGHDLDKIAGQILAWLHVRDGEHYKFDDETQNAIFIIQGNAHTSVEMRLEALKRIENDLAECMPNLEFETYVICSEKKT